MASIVTLLTLNTNKRADLGGLASIIKETRPHVVFIQEALSYNLVSSLASASGYRCWASTLPGVRRDRTSLSSPPSPTQLYRKLYLARPS